MMWNTVQLPRFSYCQSGQIKLNRLMKLVKNWMISHEFTLALSKTVVVVLTKKKIPVVIPRYESKTKWSKPGVKYFGVMIDDSKFRFLQDETIPHPKTKCFWDCIGLRDGFPVGSLGCCSSHADLSSVQGVKIIFQRDMVKPVSYTHLDVYKRQSLTTRNISRAHGKKI